MATDHIPVFLPASEPLNEDKGRHWHRASIVLGILFLAGAAIVFTVLSTHNPEELFAHTTASVVSKSALAAQTMPIIQPTGGAEALVPAASDAPTGDEVASGAKTTENGDPGAVGPSPVQRISGLGGGGRCTDPG